MRKNRITMIILVAMSVILLAFCSAAAEGTKPTVTVDSNRVLMQDWAVFHIQAEGLTADTTLQYRINESDYPETVYYPRVSGNTATWSPYISYRPMTYTYSFRVQINQEWSEWSDPVEIEVYSLGELGMPEAEVKSSFRAGEPVSIDIEELPNASYYTLECREAGAMFSDFYFSSLSSGNQVIFPFGMDAGEYELTLKAEATHYESNNWNSITFTVTGERPAAPEVNYDPECEAGDTVILEVSSEGRAIEAAARIWPFNDWEYDLYYANEGAVQIPYFANQSTITIRARVDGVWSTPTDNICLPDYESWERHDPKLTMAKEITQGQDLTLTVGEVTGAGYYAYGVSRYNEEQDCDQDIVYERYLDAGESTIVIPFYYLFQPGQYQITVNAYMADQYHTWLGQTTEPLTVKANSNLHDAPAVSLLTEDNVTNRDIRFSVQTGSAQQMLIQLYECSEDYLDSWGTSCVDLTAGSAPYIYTTQISRSGEYAAAFAVCENGIWSEFSQSVPFTVSSAHDELGPTNVEGPEEAVIGDEVTLRWKTVSEADGYTITLQNDENDRIYFEQKVGKGTTKYTLDTGAIPDLPAGEYSLSVFAYASDYDEEYGYGNRTDIRLLDPATRPVISLADNTGGVAVIRVDGIAAERLLTKINGQEAGMIGVDPAYSSQTVQIPVTDGYMELEIANRGISMKKWSAWSNKITISNYTHTIFLPADLTHVGTEAFKGISASGGVNIVFSGDVASIDENAFDTGNVLFVVPDNSYAMKWAKEHGIPYVVRKK